MLVSLVSVVGLAKILSPSIEAAVATAEAPKALIGISVALLVLLPETWAAVRAARADRLQTSLKLALGSALASIGLTIPAVAFFSVLLGIPLVLGLDPKDLVLLTLTFLVGAITLGTSRTNMMQGAVHLVGPIARNLALYRSPIGAWHHTTHVMEEPTVARLFGG